MWRATFKHFDEVSRPPKGKYSEVLNGFAVFVIEYRGPLGELYKSYNSYDVFFILESGFVGLRNYALHDVVWFLSVRTGGRQRDTTFARPKNVAGESFV